MEYNKSWIESRVVVEDGGLKVLQIKPKDYRGVESVDALRMVAAIESARYCAEALSFESSVKDAIKMDPAFKTMLNEWGRRPFKTAFNPVAGVVWIYLLYR